jgi:hypothetical protein
MYFSKPAPDEYNAYYQSYIDRVPEGDLIDYLVEQGNRIDACIQALPGDRLDYRYASGKWTTREVVGHMLDTEWIFVYRILRIARGDRTPLAGMDQDDFMRGVDYSRYAPASLAAEFGHLRAAAVEMFRHFDEAILSRSGIASGFPFTVKALMFIVAGHAEHHLKIIEERYLGVGA